MRELVSGVIVTDGSDQPPVDSAELAAHIASPTPHPAYDDDMGLVVYFENGLA